MLYVYRRRNSTGARDLAEGIMLGLEGVRGLPARRTRGQALQTLTNQDQVICWGDFFAAPAGTKTLNNVEPLSKFAEAKKLAEKGVATIQVSRTRPAVAARPPFQAAAYTPRTMNLGAGQFTEAQVQQIVREMQDWVRDEGRRRETHAQAQDLLRQQYNAQPAQNTGEWLARRNNHVGGNDLLNPDGQADFYSKKEDIVEEYRVHMFKGRSIRAGKKIQKTTRPDGRTAPHAWIRSYDAGWIIQYDGFQSTKPMRKLAKQALEALGLDFGAIDIGKKRDGSLIVLEVNRAPGVEGGTVESYAKHIINWVRNPESYNKDEE